jgi:hypothetical protein
MALEFLGALVAAIAFGGIGLVARSLSGWRLPKWIVPFAAALGLIGTTIFLEYGWFSRIKAALPPGFEVVDSATRPSALRPWTYVLPITMSFTALQHDKTIKSPAQPSLRIVLLHDFARWQNRKERLMAVDCAANRQALMVTGAEISDDGTLTGAEWTVVPEGDTLQQAACKEG